MSSHRQGLLGLLLLALGAGCAPMTFSKQASVDFDAYPSLSFELGGPDGSERQSQYLEDELRAHSGFRSITRASVETFEPATAHLDVQLTLHAEGGGAVVVLFDDDQDREITYSGNVSYRLTTSEGRLLDTGADSVDDEDTYFSAAESALDEVVFHYLRPYRL